MDARESSSLTDSPWFWVMMFSLVALGALAAIGGKYGRRQAAIERQYQARTRVAEQQASENNLTDDTRTDQQTASRNVAMSGDTLIPIWPLAILLISVALFAGIMLIRDRGRPGSPVAERKTT